ncbi:MAG: PorT family protein, partial [Flavobacteriales bacterium]|nr:PorT family protein [Flavobacteriales bacterium]
YFEYIFNDKIGLRGSLLYGKKEDNYFQLESFTIDVSTLQFNPVIKYNFGQNYDKGLYLFTGPSATFILKTENDGDEITDFYKKVNYGVQLGFGVNFLKYFAFELKVYQGFSKFLDAVEEKNYYVDFSATVLFKIDKLIAK